MTQSPETSYAKRVYNAYLNGEYSTEEAWQKLFEALIYELDLHILEVTIQQMKEKQMPEASRPYQTIERTIWRRMLQLGHSLDVAKGGLYDSRSMAINVWVSPEDHPASWEGVVMTAGSYPEPREVLGSIVLELESIPENACTLHLTCTPYVRDESVRGGVRRTPGDSPEPMEDEWAWLRQKADALHEMAERILEPPGAEDGIFCRLCEGPVKANLLNDFLNHLIEAHRIQISSVVLGERTVIHTNAGEIEV